MANNSNKIIKFKNGLQINVIKDLGSELIGIVIKLHLKEQFRDGLPHLFEHLVINKIKKPSFLKINASTTPRFIAFKIIGIEEDIYDFLKEFVYNLINFEVTKRQLESEKLIVKQELLQYRTSQLEKFASEARNITFDSKNEYQDTILGSSDDIDHITLEKVFNFARNNLAVDNISCLVAGNHVDDSILILKQLDKLPTYKIKNNTKSSFTKNSILTKNSSCKGVIDKAKVANVSIIFRLTNNKLSKSKIFSLSLIFSILTSGENSLISQLHKLDHHIYFLKVLPIYRGESIYVQIILSCLPEEAKNIVANIKIIVTNLKEIPEKIQKDAFKNLYLQQNILFDGIEHSVNSFSNMEYEQEEIISFEDIKYQDIIEGYNNLISQMLLSFNSINTFIEYD